MTTMSQSTPSATRLTARLRTLCLAVVPTIRTIASLTVSGLRRSDRLVRNFEPWGLVLAFIGLVIALTTILIDLEDRQSERIFRAWQVVRGFEIRDNGTDSSVGASGSSLRQALEYLNRDFDGFVCARWVGWASGLLTGNVVRECLFPVKVGESFSGLNAPEVSLFNIDLRDASLIGATLVHADLRHANFSDAFLSEADFSGADLRDARFTNAYAPYTEFKHAILTEASLIRSEFHGANFAEANLTQANFAEANLSTADFSGARFQNTHLNGADLSDATLIDVNFSASNFTDVDLTRADLQGAYVTQVQLDSACGAAPPLNIPSGRIWRSGPCP